MQDAMADIIIGVDPGVHGALAWFLDRELFYVQNLPKIDESKPTKGAALRDIIGGAKVKRSFKSDTDGLVKTFRAIVRGRPATMILERVHTFPGQGAVSTGKLIKSFGDICGAASMCGIQILPVDPTEWKRRIGANSDKRHSLQMAKRLFPLFAHEFEKQLDHNKAEAALIGYYGVKWIP
jgi:hypothetical protein